MFVVFPLLVTVIYACNSSPMTKDHGVFLQKIDKKGYRNFHPDNPAPNLSSEATL